MQQICVLGWKLTLLVVGVFVGLAGGSWALWPLMGPATVVVTVSAAAGIIVAVQLHMYKGIGSVLPYYFRRLYQQVDSRISLDRAIQPGRPLPPMGGVAVLPDFAVLVVDQILDRKPNTIVELGSGTSTVLSGYCLQKLGDGRVHSFDHLKRFADETAERVCAHGLDGVATVTHAPLKPVTCDGERFEWYDTEVFKQLKAIDMLVVDGPPAELGPQARYPALPVLLDKLSDDAVIILDDAGRSDELAMVKRWLAKFEGFDEQFIPTEKGATVLRRHK